METVVYLIQNERILTKVVDGVEGLAMNNRDAIGDTYKFILAKMAAYECLDVEKVQLKMSLYVEVCVLGI